MELATPPVDRTIKALRARVTLWRSAGAKVALVPTMGSLHAGHIALVREARKRAGKVVVSIFVNPTQFAPNEDFATYPRDEAADLAKLDGLADAVFAPTVAEMYPDGATTSITVSGPANDLESNSRPHFFAGVATVVAKLLQAALPDIAVFGEKDYQQLLVVKRMVADLGFPVEIVGVPTMREADGLALSSRNAYLSPADRAKAPRLHAALVAAAEAIRYGTTPDVALSGAQSKLTAVGFRVDYVKMRNAETLAPVKDADKEPKRLLAAAWLGKTRLIDNIPV
ncbi:MAG TPA: pantoate--beta-alanine ligase [Bauldia sp.]|nr:pantoate--beta-alanine ligase [Bauldia sp.]